MSWILDYVPYWLWFAAAGVAAIATMPLWLPLARVVWAALPSWAKATIIGVGAALGAYLAGRNRGSSDERQRQKDRDAGAVRRRQDTDKRIGTMGETEVDKELDKWKRRGE